MLSRLLTADLATLLLVFCRIGSAIMVMPGFGDAFVAARVRLLIALTLTLVVAPTVAGTIPELPDALPGAVIVIVGEIAVGLMIGIAARVSVAALQTAGSIVAFQASLSNAFTQDAVSAQQGEVVSVFLSTVGVLLVFATDLHHAMLSALVDSYSVFVPGATPPIGDAVDTITRLVAESFRLAVQIAAPFIVVGIVLFIGLGLIARLMPQVQIFFLATPVQVVLGVILMGLTLSTGMGLFLGHFEDTLDLFRPKS